LLSESFWRLVPKDKPEGELKKDKVNYSISHLREEFMYALIDQSLYDYLQDPTACARLRCALIGRYLAPQADGSQGIGKVTAGMIAGLILCLVA